MSLSKEEKLKVYNAHITEKEIISNKERIILMGDTKITIKQLIWDDANDFEDEILKVVSSFSDIKLDTENLDINTIAEVILGNVLRDGLLRLATLATSGKVDLQFVRDSKSTKDDVIRLVVESIMLNYSYIKNLLALGRKLI